MVLKSLGGGSLSTIHLWTPLYITRYSRSYSVIIDNIAHVFPFYSSKFTRKPTLGVVYHVNGRAIKKVMPFPLYIIGSDAEKSLPYIYRRSATISRSIEEDLVRLGVNPMGISVIYYSIDHYI